MPELDSEEEDELDEKFPPIPGHKPHRCTDVPWLFFFLLACMGQICVLNYAYLHGDHRKLTRGFDRQGRLCGVDTPVDTQEVYWCRDPTDIGGSFFDNPICVSACPKGSNGTRPCMGPGDLEATETLDYATHRVLHFCMPTKTSNLRAVMKMYATNTSVPYPAQVAGQIYRAWLPLLVAVNVAMLSGLGFLLLLKRHAVHLLHFSEFVAIAGTFGSGGFLLYVSYQGGSDGIHGTGDRFTDLAVGVACCFVGLIVLVIVFCCERSMNLAVGCIEATCECMFGEPSLLLEPFFALAVRAVLFATVIPGLIWLVTAGKVTNGGRTDGFSRDFEFSNEQKMYMVAFAVITLWLVEFTHALSQYVVAYTAQMWYFTPFDENDAKPDRTPCGILSGLGNALRYHVGTLALGSLLIAYLRLPRIAVGVVVRALTVAENPLAACISRCCCCLEWLYEGLLARVSKHSYVEVAISSCNFCTGARRSLDVLTTQLAAVKILTGAHAVFIVAGLAAIAGSSGLMTLLMCERLPEFSVMDSPNYVRDPKMVAGLAGILGGMISLSFMLVFDTVSDTILYCFALNHRRHSQIVQRYSTGAQEQDGAGYFGCGGWRDGEQEQGYFDWLVLGFGAAADTATEAPAKVRYAPTCLEKAIDEHS